MSEGTKQRVDTNSVEFKEGLDAGLNSLTDTRNWEAGNELGQELKDLGEKKGPVSETSTKEPPTPLFESDSQAAKSVNLQDEKDETAE